MLASDAIFRNCSNNRSTSLLETDSSLTCVLRQKLMPSKSSRSLSSTLRDILENIDLATIFVAGMSLEGFRTDKRTRYAVVRCLEIISEASRRLPPEIKMRHPELPWSNMAGAGNV